MAGLTDGEKNRNYYNWGGPLPLRSGRSQGQELECWKHLIVKEKEEKGWESVSLGRSFHLSTQLVFTVCLSMWQVIDFEGKGACPVLGRGRALCRYMTGWTGNRMKRRSSGKCICKNGKWAGEGKGPQGKGWCLVCPSLPWVSGQRHRWWGCVFESMAHSPQSLWNKLIKYIWEVIWIQKIS